MAMTELETLRAENTRLSEALKTEGEKLKAESNRIARDYNSMYEENFKLKEIVTKATETVNAVQNEIRWLSTGAGNVGESVQKAWNLNAFFLNKNGEFQTEYFSLNEKLTIAREALEFYASKESWILQWGAPDYGPSSGIQEDDNDGDRARSTLSRIEGVGK